MTPRQHVPEARRVLKERLSAEPGFRGIGISADPDGDPVLVVFVVDARSPAATRAPRSVLGIPVRVEVVGEARKQSGSGDAPES